MTSWIDGLYPLTPLSYCSFCRVQNIVFWFTSWSGKYSLCTFVVFIDLIGSFPWFKKKLYLFYGIQAVVFLVFDLYFCSITYTSIFRCLWELLQGFSPCNNREFTFSWNLQNRVHHKCWLINRRVFFFFRMGLWEFTIHRWWFIFFQQRGTLSSETVCSVIRLSVTFLVSDVWAC